MALAASCALNRPRQASLAAVFSKESNKENSGNYVKHKNVTVATKCQRMRDSCFGRQLIAFSGLAFL